MKTNYWLFFIFFFTTYLVSFLLATCTIPSTIVQYGDNRRFQIVDTTTRIPPTSLTSTLQFSSPTTTAQSLPDAAFIIHIYIPYPITGEIPSVSEDFFGIYQLLNTNTEPYFTSTAISTFTFNLQSFQARRPIVGNDGSDCSTTPCYSPSTLYSIPQQFFGMIQFSIVSLTTCTDFFPQSTRIYPVSNIKSMISINYPKIQYQSTTITGDPCQGDCTQIVTNRSFEEGGDYTDPRLSNAVPGADIYRNTACSSIIDNNGNLVQFDAMQHSSMCSNPTSGKWVQIRTDTSPWVNEEALQNKVCDCQCNGYFENDSTTIDNRKCTKCALQCPELMVPNKDCTMCECTQQCQKYNRYVHTTLYLSPRVLYFIFWALEGHSGEVFEFPIDNTHDVDFMSRFNARVEPYHIQLFTQTMKGFGTVLTSKLQQQYNPTTLLTTWVNDIIITPLLYGNYLTWKVTLDIDISDNIDNFIETNNYGLPTLNGNDILQWFGDHLQSIVIDRQNIGFPEDFDITTTQWIIPSNGINGFKYYINDTFGTRCLIDGQHDDSLLTWNDVKDQLCPEPMHYQSTSYTTDDRTQRFWTQCDSQRLMIYEQVFPEVTLQTYGNQHGTGFIIQNNNNDINHNRNNNNNEMNNTNTKFQFETQSPIRPTIIKPTDVTVYIGVYPSSLSENGPYTFDSNTSIYYNQLEVTTLRPICFDFTGNRVEQYGVSCNYNYIPIWSENYQDIIADSSIQKRVDIQIEPFDESSANNGVYTYRTETIKYSLYPNFPSFPAVTRMLCPDPLSTIELPIITDMNTSPTHVAPDQHLTVRWQGSGSDLGGNIGIRIKPITPNNGTGTFIWRQSLNIGPLSTGSSITQLPNADTSRLYYYLGLSEEHRNQYMNQDAVIEAYSTMSMDMSFIATTTPKMNLPTLCTTYNIQCGEPTTQICHEMIGRCICKDGYYNRNENNMKLTILQSQYIFDYTRPTALIDNNTQLQCQPICQNGGIYNIITKQCQCENNNYIGQYCEISFECNPIDQWELIPPQPPQTIPYYPPNNTTTTTDGDDDAMTILSSSQSSSQLSPIYLQQQAQYHNDVIQYYINKNKFQSLLQKQKQQQQQHNDDNHKYIFFESLDDIPTTNDNDNDETNELIISPTNFTHKQCNNGYYQSTITIDSQSSTSTIQCHNNTNTDQCQCLSSNWKINQTTLLPCSTCILQPDLNIITTPLQQQYLTTNDIENGVIQTCYILGTNHIKTWGNGSYCDKCICQRGFTGKYCQLHQIYIAMNFTGDNNYTNNYIDRMILQDKLIDELYLTFDMLSTTTSTTSTTSSLSSPTTLLTSKEQIEIIELNFEYNYIIFGIESGIDFFKENELYNNNNNNNSTMQILQSQSQSPPIQPIKLDNYYSTWSTITNNISTTPLGSLDSNSYLNNINNNSTTKPLNIYDPACTQRYSNCNINAQQLYDVWKTLQSTNIPPVINNTDTTTNTTNPNTTNPDDPTNNDNDDNDTTLPPDDNPSEEIPKTPTSPIGDGDGSGSGTVKTASTTTVIIVIVCVIVGVILFFAIITIVLVRARKNQTMCWKPQERSNNNKGKNSNNISNDIELGSTGTITETGAATTTTSTTTAATSTTVPSLTNRTPVEDPTLNNTDWSAFQDEKGKLYYVNNVTMSSQWTHPVHENVQENGW